jgi:hypothetical protein
MDQLQEAFQPVNRNSDAMKAFGFRLKNQFSVNEAYRRPKELQWLEDLRAYKGIYDPDVRIEANASKVYPKITRSKINIVLSRLHEMLFPETDKNWEINPTPEPKVSRESVQKIAEGLVQKKEMEAQIQAQQAAASGVSPAPPEIPTIDELRLAIKKFADETCALMSNVIDDQLTEMLYPEETKKVLRSGLTYGTGVMKGPMIRQKTKHRWEPVAGGDFAESKKIEEVPYFEFVRLWDWYPDMTVTELEMIEGSFQRHLMTKHDLRQLLKRDDYYSEMILEYMRDNPSGDYVPKAWEVDLQTIEVMAGSGNKGAGYTMTAGTTNVNDLSRTSDRQIGKKYQVLEYWGYIDGSDLEACGVHIPDPTLEYAANVWLLGNVPIKAALYDGALDQYKVFYYEKDETSLFGEGLARVMRHSQLAVCAAARMALDNAACVSGPQVEVNWSLLTPDTDVNSFYPRKIWYREGRGIEAQYPAIRVYNIESHVEELSKIVDMFKQFGDEETTLPTWMIGQMVQNETAQATSGRMATITISIKDVVKNFDAFTEGIIRDLYAWNMDFNPRSDIKGDFNVKARGVSSLVMKEIRMQALAQLTNTLTEDEWIYIPKREFLVEKMKAHDINIKLLTEDEADEVRKAMENSEMAMLQKEAMKAAIAKDKAQAASNLTKAKEKNILANKEASTPPETEAAADPRLQDMELRKKEAEINDISAKTSMKIEEAQAKTAALTQKAEEAQLASRTKLAMEAEKHQTDLEIKKKQADHAMKMKEKASNQQKNVKNSPKPAKKD